MGTELLPCKRQRILIFLSSREQWQGTAYGMSIAWKPLLTSPSTRAVLVLSPVLISVGE